MPNPKPGEPKRLLDPHPQHAGDITSWVTSQRNSTVEHDMAERVDRMGKTGGFVVATLLAIILGK